MHHSLVTLDTNIVISAQLNPFGAPGRIWDLVTARQIQLAYDDRILLEYETVLRRPKFGFHPAHIDALLTMLEFQQSVSTKPWQFQPLPDPSDATFLEVALAASCPLITGNTRHYPNAVRGSVTVLKPDEWLKSFILKGGVRS